MPVLRGATQKQIDKLVVPEGKSRVEYTLPDRCPGMYLEKRASNPHLGTWYLRFRNAAGKTQHLRLGTTATHSLGDAAKEALQQKAALARGCDPRKEKKEIPTLQTFALEQYLPYVKQRNRSWHTDEKRLNHRLLPRFGEHRLDALNKMDFSSWCGELIDEGLAPGTVDHLCKLARRILNLAKEWEIIDVNSLAGIKLMNRDNTVQHLLSDTQLERLMTVLHTHRNRLPCLVARFLLSTGCRLNEALTCRLESIDFENRLWMIEAANNKGKRVRAVPLSDLALEVLEEASQGRREGWAFVRNTGERLKTMHTAWKVIRTEAGMPWLRLHDLRHNMISILINQGHSLYTAGQIAGHRSPQVTQRYAHLSAKTLHEAAATADAKLRAASPKLLPAKSALPAPSSRQDS